VNDLNSLLVEGNMVRDPELKYTSSGTAVCTFSIASNRSWKKGEEWEKEVSYFDCELWGKLAESIKERTTKGRGVRVIGRLKQERWSDSEGKQKSKVKIVAEHVEVKPESKKGNQLDQKESESPEMQDDIPF
jgi:single-strand DNA-binding protein